MSEQQSSKLPQIRFKGFEAKWVEKKLGDVATFLNGRAYSQNELLSKGRYKVLRVGNFYTNSSWYYSDMNLAERFYANKGDLLYTWSASFGPHIWEGDKVIYHYHIWKIELSEVLTKSFTLQLLENDRKRILDNSNGSTMVHITKEGIEGKSVVIPHPAEQQKIGKYFQELDGLIRLHQRKHDKLVTLKKAMLQKMFPQPGATTPEIRFKGFQGDWVEKKLGEVGAFNPKEALPEIFEYVDLESVVGTEMVNHRTETRKTAPSRAQRLARQGDLFFQTVRPYQKNNYLFTLPFTNYVFSTGYAQIRPFDDGSFLLGLMQRDHFVKVVLDHCTGTSYPAINANVLADIFVMVPTPEEQQKIGTYFRTLDELISQHATQLQKLQQIKSACLERMFV
ncbi:restriction endonuclease subunit S [Rhodoferax sp. TBRC 17660]|uniref:Restriction endonuclease subunit S n=1 Tax=Rhodoferax potami TaxID=3068338 RepID=A0ABU3KSB0_9BURK|nr:restriction endonuclease subunit S [Rhodoferax sp. TBRC 17660]MDT7520565.1 restriction endonuclease subunit S [Rhodoferax sp. TBRC 17660]